MHPSVSASMICVLFFITGLLDGECAAILGNQQDLQFRQ